MQTLVNALRALPPDPNASSPEPSFLAEVSDHDLVVAVANAIERPKAERFSSFLLHAPLELLARASLLPMVAPRHRADARRRIAEIAALYADGDELDVPDRSIASPDAAWSMLIAALHDGDPDTADAAIAYISDRQSVERIAAGLVDQIAPMLGAAAHAPLLFAAQLDAQPRFERLPLMLRPAIRMLASAAAKRLSWMDARCPEDGPEDLWAAFNAAPSIVLDTDFIAPTMLAVEADGLAAGLLARATRAPVGEVGTTLLRIAATSMLQEPPDHAPYGWTHCLSLAQGLLALRHLSRDPQRLARIATTYVLGFRSTLGVNRLETMTPPSPGPAIVDLADCAATHRDAHLVKYVVACQAASAADPAAAPLFAAAAGHLAAYWQEQPALS